jgi:hypothetical protein
MPLVQPCREPDCPTLTMGDRCLEHERAAADRRSARVRAAAARFRGPALAVGVAVLASVLGRASGRLVP